MPAVRSVLVVGAGAAGCATATLLAEAGVSVDLIDIKPDVSALGSGITLQGNALRVLRQLGVWDQVAERGYAFDTLGLRAPDPDGTLIVELTDVRTGGEDLPATVGMYRPDLAADPRRPRDPGRCQGPVRHDVHRADPGRRRRRRDVRRRLLGALRPGGRRRRRPVLDAATAGHQPRDAEHRHGDLASVRAAAGLGDPHRPLLRRTVLHRRLLPHGRGLAVRLPRRGRSQDRSRLSPQESLDVMREPGGGVPRTVGRHPRLDDRPDAGELHLVRDPPPRRTVAPRPRRADRRRRPHLPADPRPGCRAGARGRRRARRAPARRTTRSATSSGPRSPTGACPAPGRSSTPRSSSASGSSTTSRATSPA